MTTLQINDPSLDGLLELLRSEGDVTAARLLEISENDDDVLPRVVGIHGHAQVGKDTVANWLVENRGYTRMAFADAIREAIHRLNPLVPIEGSRNPDDTVFQGTTIRVATLIDHVGWDDAKVDYPEVRRMLQVLGTEVGRDLIDADVWIDITLDTIYKNPDKKYVIPDVRFLNEVQALRSMKGSLLAFILRPGVTAVNDHISDRGLEHDLFDFGILNAGSVDQLHDTLDVLFPTYEGFGTVLEAAA